MARDFDATPIILGSVCAVVGVLAALGKFNSIMNFPVIFALICLVIGLLSIWRQPRHAVALRSLVLLVGISLAIGGWVFQQRASEERQVELRQKVLDAIEGRKVPSLAGLEPLNTTQQEWDRAASLDAEATVVVFWARWCSPCWREMAELEELYRQHKDAGLRIVAVTRYDHPDDVQERLSDFTKAESFLERRDITYPSAITDRDDLYRGYLVSSPPSTFLIDDTGRVVDYAVSLESVHVLMRKAAAMVNG